MINQDSYFPAEWEAQSGVLLTWPDMFTDWADIIDEVCPVYEHIVSEILAREKLLVVCRDKNILPSFVANKAIIREMSINDTWARDHGPITVIENGNPVLLNFCFNGWGMKFLASDDNLISPNLFQSKAFNPSVKFSDLSSFVFEGGSIESNGKGCLMTTSQCLLSKYRNPQMGKEEVERYLLDKLHSQRMIWLDNGFLKGDDTDSHIDTLARFCSEDTVAYVKCDDEKDVHYDSLRKMEDELIPTGFKLVPLPFPDAVFDDGSRLPATYANFLIMNEAVLFPVFGVDQDAEALNIAKKLFPTRQIVAIDSVPLIKQHGSVHCITMQFPSGVL